jgi:flagellar biosynthetic protein FlhB
MAGGGHEEDRTEAATPRRLQRAREQGQVPVSRELTTFAGLAAVGLVVFMAAPGVAREVAVRLSVFLANAHQLSADGSAVQTAGLVWLRATAPFVLAAMLAGVAVVLLQTRFLLSGKALRVDISRVNPLAGFKRLFSVSSLVEAAKSLVKLAVLGVVLWQVVYADVPGLLRAIYGEPGQLLARLMWPLQHVIFVVLAAQAAIAAGDYFWVTLRHARGLRMSRHELQEEQKETEGDPRVKGRIKQIRSVRARRRMLAAVPKATVVITNPTHYAVALLYDREKHAAPRVVAKGVDSLAARIREVAESNRIPLVANPPLARALYRVDVDATIPAEHYQAVAEVIAYVWRLGRPRGAAA